MSNNITLIESEKLDDLLTKAFAYDELIEYGEINWQRVQIKISNYLKSFVTMPMDFDQDIIDKLEEIYDEGD